MPKFMFLYRGPQPDMSAMTPEIGAAVMEQMERLDEPHRRRAA